MDQAATQTVSEAPPVHSVDQEPRWLAAAGAMLLLAVVVGLTLRDAGTYAHSFADERTYSYYSRVVPLGESGVPSYLYLAIFSSTSSCGDGALSCARLLNALFFAGALPFLYLVGRRYASWRSAAVVVVMTAVSSFNTYTAFFMPEATYFFGFWVLVWLLTEPNQRWTPLTAGLVVGLLTLVKLHGLFLIPSTALLVAHAGWSRDRSLGALVTVAAFGSTVLLVRFGGGWLLAGKAGLSLLGPLYGAHAAVGRPVGELLRLSLGVGWRHLQALSVLYALPLTALVLGLLPSARGASVLPSPPRIALRLEWVLLLFLVPLLIITAVFSANAAGSGPYEAVGRLHMRYYNFLAPLLLLVGAARLEREARADQLRQWGRILTSAVVIAVAVFSLAVGLRSVHAISPDCPELLLLRTGLPAFVGLACLGLASLALWAFRPRLGHWVYLLLALPVMTLVATGAATDDVTATRVPTRYDSGGEVARRLLGREGVEHVHVVSADIASCFRVLFTLNNRAGTFDSFPEGSVLRRPSPEKDWLLYFGNYVIEGPHRVVVASTEFTLIHFE